MKTLKNFLSDIRQIRESLINIEDYICKYACGSCGKINRTKLQKMYGKYCAECIRQLPTNSNDS